MTKVVHDYSKVPGFEYMAEPDWIIGNRVYRIQAPAYLMANESEIEMYGSFYSGDPRRDATAAKGPADGWRTILQMYDIWQEKGFIRLVNYQKDIEEIHTVIQAYFQKLADFQRIHEGGSRNLRTSDPVQYVRLIQFAKSFDLFAKDVFTLAVGYNYGGKPEEEEDLATMIPIPTEQRGEPTGDMPKYSPASDIIDFNRSFQRKRY